MRTTVNTHCGQVWRHSSAALTRNHAYDQPPMSDGIHQDIDSARSRPSLESDPLHGMTSIERPICGPRIVQAQLPLNVDRRGDRSLSARRSSHEVRPKKKNVSKSSTRFVANSFALFTLTLHSLIRNVSLTFTCSIILAYFNLTMWFCDNKSTAT